MASIHIAGAACVSKSAFDRSEILRGAHRQARSMIRYGAFRGTYRQALASGLRLCWYAAKLAADDAAWEAAQAPISADVEARVADLREEAWFEPFTSAGNARHVALLAEAAAIAEHARQAA